MVFIVKPHHLPEFPTSTVFSMGMQRRLGRDFFLYQIVNAIIRWFAKFPPPQMNNQAIYHLPLEFR